ncbi:MAG: hypothetical protein Q4B03_05155 [Lachnospiraceae bacterium]|nr:hypothetical protein [Lachnospiraceae bacterium]
MNDRKKLAQMIRAARFEEKIGIEDLRIVKYFRRDYVAFAMIRNFFVVTIGYGLLLAALLLYHMDFLLSNLKNLNIRPLFVAIITGYLFILALYSVLVYTICSLRYLRAERRVNQYHKELKKLNSMQQSEADRILRRRKRREEEIQEGE